MLGEDPLEENLSKEELGHGDTKKETRLVARVSEYVKGKISVKK